MLMVDGTLYMMVRNAENSQLAWSRDNGISWEWADWKFTAGMGCPTFLNFGKDYEGARDQYVYLYTPDEESAYKASDHMILVRVHKKQIKNREGYEYFQVMGKTKNPVGRNTTT